MLVLNCGSLLSLYSQSIILLTWTWPIFSPNLVTFIQRVTNFSWRPCFHGNYKINQSHLMFNSTEKLYITPYLFMQKLYLKSSISIW